LIAGRIAAAITVAVAAVVAVGACGRRKATAPRPLAPRYQGAGDFALVFFDDCHCELDGMRAMNGQGDGSFVEAFPDACRSRGGRSVNIGPVP
jgi:hypothetical protein